MWPGDNATHYDISNAQLFVQKTSGWWQFYLQGGAYNLPAIGVPFLSTSDTIKNIYGPFPQGYAKFVKGNFNVEIGALPTLIGAEYTFSFQNMNVERGLLWGQENAINRGIQLNETYKKWTLALSWNDGFYSNRYTWLTGSVAYAFNSANSMAFVGGGNAGSYAKSTLATPLALNNSQIYNLIYTYTKGNLVVQPYLQITDVPTNAKIGITQGAGTRGGALLMTYNFKRGFSLAPRIEYIATRERQQWRGKPALRPGQQRVLVHRDTDISQRTRSSFVETWRLFTRPHDVRLWFRDVGSKRKSTARRCRSRLHVLIAMRLIFTRG